MSTGTKRYTTIGDFEDHEVIPALGEHADDFDTRAIAREASEYRVDTITGRWGKVVGGGGAFEQAVSGEEFWDIAQKHHTGAGTAAYRKDDL